jgi:hypothetical protein
VFLCASVSLFCFACSGLHFFQRFCLWHAVLYIIYILEFFLNSFLQERIDTVTVEGVENVGEGDCIKMKTEEDYKQLVGTVKSEQEVSVLCWYVLW